MTEYESGFTLLELIVVILIIGVLAAISIPSFLDQRQHGHRTAIQSDLRTVAIEAETFFGDNDTYDGFEADNLFASLAGTNDVVLAIEPANTTATSICVEARHGQLPATEVWSYRNDRSPQLGDAAC